MNAHENYSEPYRGEVVRVSGQVYTYINAYIHIYIYTYEDRYVYYLYSYMYVYMCVCVCMCPLAIRCCTEYTVKYARNFFFFQFIASPAGVR